MKVIIMFIIFTVFLKERDKLQKYLLSNNINTGNHYPVPCHLQKPYQRFGYKKNDFPQSEKIANRQISLPIYPEIKVKMIKYVAAKINKWISNNS